MNIKLIITSRLSYYFCGSIALSILNSSDNPLVVDLDKLSKQEVIGLTRASKTGVIKAIEGEAELYAKAETFTTKKKRKKEAPKEETIAKKIEEVIEEIKQPVVEVQPEPEVQEVVEVEVKIEEEVKETPKTTARKRTTTVKK